MATIGIYIQYINISFKVIKTHVTQLKLLCDLKVGVLLFQHLQQISGIVFPASLLCKCPFTSDILSFYLIVIFPV